MFEQFLDGIRGKFTQDTYHLLTNNCNNFTDEAATFLTGTGAPDCTTPSPSLSHPPTRLPARSRTPGGGELAGAHG